MHCFRLNYGAFRHSIHPPPNPVSAAGNAPAPPTAPRPWAVASWGCIAAAYSIKALPARRAKSRHKPKSTSKTATITSAGLDGLKLPAAASKQWSGKADELAAKEQKLRERAAAKLVERQQRSKKPNAR